MRNLFCATNPLIKWLKADLPRLPAGPGKQVGVNDITSTSEQMCWQLPALALDLAIYLNT